MKGLKEDMEKLKREKLDVTLEKKRLERDISGISKSANN